MEPQEAEIPKGSYAAGRRVRLPRGAERPIRVYVNGIEQTEGVDYEVRGGEIVFARPIVKETVTPGRWMAMYLGLFGTYRKNETVDVEYRLGGQTKLASDVEILPDYAARPGRRGGGLREADQVGDALAVPARVPSSCGADAGALEQEVEVVLPGEADPAEGLDRVVGDRAGGVGGARLRHRGRERQ